MQKYSDSFNLFFGFNNLPKNFNVFDNDFFELKAYSQINGTIDNKFELGLRFCDKKDFDFIDNYQEKYYKGSICFEDKSKVNVRGDWFN